MSLSPYSFDGFVFDAFYSLLNGASVYLVDKELLLNPEELCGYIAHHNIDTFFTTTALFNQLIRSGKLKNTGVRNILFGGEKSDLGVIRQALDELDLNLVHVYGPTETVVFASAYHFEGTDTQGAPIGSPLNNKRFYVVDASGELVPVGCPGELWIGGAGMARGYLNRADLTADRFIDNPFATEQDKANGYTKVYKTGDLVRWLPDGVIDFMGRIDKQVKIRGHRIEPEEIERVLSELEGVSHSVVVDLEKEGGKYLAAYVVMNNESDFSAEVLRSKLERLLPDYMVPATFTELTAIPLTINGKLDRKALPDPEFTSTESYVAPRTALEEQLCNIWQEVLGVEKVGIQDNFFHIGGDSIVAIRVISKAKAQGLYFSVQDLFTSPKIGELSGSVNTITQSEDEYVSLSLVSEDQRTHLESIYGENLSDAFPATYLQMGMLVESKLERGTYHDVINYRINALYDEVRLRTLLNDLVNRHEVLRTGFIEETTAGYLAFVLKNQAVHLEFLEETLQEEVLISKEHDRGFDFSVAGLYRFLISDIKADSFQLTFSLHHAIIDGWSEASLIAQLIEAYMGESTALSSVSSLPGYGEFAQKEQRALKDPAFLNFWSAYLSGYEPPVVP
jgi:tyrocidine synthetase-3